MMHCTFQVRVTSATPKLVTMLNFSDSVCFRPAMASSVTGIGELNLPAELALVAAEAASDAGFVNLIKTRSVLLLMCSGRLWPAA